MRPAMPFRAMLLLPPEWSLLCLPDYNVSAKCPHCGNLNFLDRMSEAQYARSEPLLMSVLHAVICRQCSQRFGKHAGALVATVVD
jgi:hypothetical protein